MKSSWTPKLDVRTAQAIVAELMARLPGYTPNWTPAEGGPGLAVVQVFARYLQALIERLNQAPDKNKLAFLDMLGVNLLPAQAARAPVVFQAIANIGDSRVPARTRVGAQAPGRSEPLVFETERAIGMATAQLVEVVTLWPDRDAYADHSLSIARNKSFTLFEPLRPIAHEIYLAHNVDFALIGKSMVELQCELASPGAQPLSVAWEYWDGERWQGFRNFNDEDQEGESFDGTEGLSRSGVIRLITECGDAAKTKVNGIEAYWVRGRLTEPLPPQPGARLPAVDRIRLRTMIERPLRPGCKGDIQPDQAFADGTKLDLSKSFLPLGKLAGRENTFYFASEEVFSKPGAEVTICFGRPKTPEEETDELEAAQLEKAAQKLILHAAGNAAQAVIAAGQSVHSLGTDIPPEQGDVGPLLAKIQDLMTTKNSLQEPADIDGLADAAADVVVAINNLKSVIAGYLSGLSEDETNADTLKKLIRAAGDFTVNITSSAQDVLDTLGKLGALVAASANDLVLNAARAAAKTVIDAAQSLISLSAEAVAFIQGVKESEQLKLATDDLTDTSAIADLAMIAQTVVKAIDQEFEVFLPLFEIFTSDSDIPENLVNLLHNAATNAQSILIPLSELGELEGAGTVDNEATTLSPPRLVWEYFDGRSWQNLLGPDNDDPANFLNKNTGEVSFVVPGDLTPTIINNVTARWIRVRLESGVFGRLRLVSWHDAVSNKVNQMPIIEPRPPALEGFFLGYTYRSTRATPEYCLTYNDFQYEDHSRDARFPGSPFPVFRPTDDRTPTLYLGFDRTLPADLISLYLDIVEEAERIEGPPLKWEYHDGAEWLPLSVEDETANFALPGMVAAIWPGGNGAAPATVVQANGAQAQLIDARQAARFAPGDLLYIVQDGDGELTTVESVERNTLKLAAPLSRLYMGATIGPASLPRFGRPRTWIRARLETEGDPLRSRVNGVYLNAVWAAQIQTIENELVGSSDAQAGQVLFLRQTPVLEGEVIEVRELDGPRAAVELPILREELLRQGLTDADIRTVQDRRTGQISEAWVRWRVRHNLFFSGPDDRDLVIERTRGRLIFGDNANGRIARAGADNIRASVYRSGGGLIGNVSARALTQLLSGVLAQSVSNPRAAEGGADGETVQAALIRGPQAMRHRRQALSRADYEGLAREASPAVAAVRALPTTHPNGRPAPGRVTIIIVPQSHDPQPQPSFELRRRVRDFLLARVPASMAGLDVIGPDYLPIGVQAVIVPISPQDAGPVGERASQELAKFLHPLTGGPEGEGWPFGRNVYLSDVAALLESIPGVNYVETINLLLDGTPRGEIIVVPSDRIVVAGPFEIKLKGGEG